VTRYDRLIASAHDDGLVLFEIPTGRIFSANRTARIVWERLEAGDGPIAGAKALVESYGIPLAVAILHVDRFIDSVATWGLQRPWTGARCRA
jgi:hypothetical protein